MRAHCFQRFPPQVDPLTFWPAPPSSLPPRQSRRLDDASSLSEHNQSSAKSCYGKRTWESLAVPFFPDDPLRISSEKERSSADERVHHALPGSQPAQHSGSAHWAWDAHTLTHTCPLRCAGGRLSLTSVQPRSRATPSHRPCPESLLLCLHCRSCEELHRCNTWVSEDNQSKHSLFIGIVWLLPGGSKARSDLTRWTVQRYTTLLQRS